MADEATKTDKTPKGLKRALAIGITIALAIIGGGLWQESKYERQAQQHARENNRHAYNDVKHRCVPLPPLAERNCAIEARRAQRDYQRDEQDLYAQKKSALWTFLMGGAAIIGMMLSAVGVWLVYTTFRETRRSANAAASSAEHAARSANAAVDQHRAWLKVSDLNVSKLKFDKATNRDGEPQYISATISVSIQNVGGTPATDVVWQPSIWAIGMLTVTFDQWAALWKRASNDYAERVSEMREYGFVMFPRDEPQTLEHGVSTLTWPVEGALHIPSTGLDERFRLMGVVTVIYRITSGDKAKTTVPFFVHLGNEGHLTIDFLKKNPEHTGAGIRVTRLQGAERAT